MFLQSDGQHFGLKGRSHYLTVMSHGGTARSVSDNGKESAKDTLTHTHSVKRFPWQTY